MSEIKRDRWERPLIIPRDGGEPRPYARASKLAKSLDDLHNIMKWEGRLIAVGLVSRPDIALQVSGILANSEDLDDWSTKKQLNALAEAAKKAAGSDIKSNTGTGLHALTEAVDQGRKLPPLSQDLADRIEEYQVETSQLTVEGVEVFVVNDELEVAGTLDRLYGFPDGRVRVGDLKTGSSDPDYPLGVTSQTAIYANSERYDPATGERSPLHLDLDRNEGVLVHMPQTGEGTHLYKLNLTLGWHAARLGHQVELVRKWKKGQLREPLQLAG